MLGEDEVFRGGKVVYFSEGYNIFFVMDVFVVIIFNFFGFGLFFRRWVCFCWSRALVV